MSRNRSLDEFVAGDRVSDGIDEGVDDGEATTDSDGARSLPSTYAWDPDGGACDACGGTVDARWRDGDELVCPDCKSW